MLRARKLPIRRCQCSLFLPALDAPIGWFCALAEMPTDVQARFAEANSEMAVPQLRSALARAGGLTALPARCVSRAAEICSMHGLPAGHG